MRHLSALVMAATAVSPVYAEVPGAEAAAFVQTVSDKIIAALQSGQGSFEKRKAAFRVIFETAADVQRMAEVAAGDAWKTASPAAREAYLTAFKEYMATSYARRFESYAGQSVTVGRVVDVGRKGILVQTKIVRADAPPTSVDWQLRPDATFGFKVVDVVAEQISMLMTHRTEFAALRGDGDLTALTAVLNRRN